MQIMLMDFTQKNKRHGIILPFLSFKMRLCYAVIAVCTAAAGILIQIEQQRLPLAAYGIAGIALLAACVTSYWELDCTARVIRSVNGVLWFAIRTEYPQAAVQNIEREVFTKGLLQSAFVKYSFYTETGTRYVMGIVPQRTAEAIDRQWEYLTASLTAADACKEQ